MFDSKIKRDITSLIRGFFFTQILCSLANLNLVDVFIKKNYFGFNDFKKVKSKKTLSVIFNYLLNLGFLEKKNNRFCLTLEGKEVFKRHSSFYVPYSYKSYLDILEQKLTNKKKSLPDINRFLNVLGSGITHKRYFISAVSYLKNFSNPTAIIDLGVGNGDFIKESIKFLKLKKIVGIDLSKKSISISKKNLSRFNKIEKKFINENANSVNKWSRKLDNFLNNEKLVISMWFLIQEIAKNDKKNFINFLNKIHKRFPSATLVICELVRIDSKLLSQNKDHSIIPEYLFFHDLSHQHVFSWKDFKDIFKNTPYKIDREYFFDEIKNNDQKIIPSTFITCLKPKN